MSPRLPIPPRLPRLLTTRTSTSLHRPPPYHSNILTLSTSPRLKRKKLLLSLPSALRLAPPPRRITFARPRPDPPSLARRRPLLSLLRLTRIRALCRPCRRRHLRLWQKKTVDPPLRIFLCRLLIRTYLLVAFRTRLPSTRISISSSNSATNSSGIPSLKEKLFPF